MSDDQRVLGVRIDGVLLKAERAAEELDSGRRIGVSQRGDDGGVNIHEPLLRR
jgi:hypothetical protein